MKNVVIMVISLFACIIADVIGGFGSSVPEFIPAAVPAVTSVTVTDINPVTMSTDITAVTSVTSAAETTNNIVSDDIIDNSVVSEVVTEYTAIYTEYTDTIEYVCSEPAAAPELVNDDIINNTVSDNTDTIVSDIQDDKNNADNTDIYNINNLYALYTIVSDINYNDDIVYCTDFNGFIWSFYGVEDWAINDICSLTMYDNNTEIIYDDIILNATYSGYIDNTDIDNIVLDNIDISDNADMIPDNTDINNTVNTSEDTLFTEYLNAISNGDYIE